MVGVPIGLAGGFRVSGQQNTLTKQLSGKNCMPLQQLLTLGAICGNAEKFFHCNNESVCTIWHKGSTQ